MKYLCTAKGENRQSMIVSLLQALNISSKVEILKVNNKNSKVQEFEFDISIPENQHEDAVKLLSQNGLISNDVCYIKEFSEKKEDKKRTSFKFVIILIILIVTVTVLYAGIKLLLK